MPPHKECPNPNLNVRNNLSKVNKRPFDPRKISDSVVPERKGVFYAGILTGVVLIVVLIIIHIDTNRNLKYITQNMANTRKGNLHLFQYN